MRRRNPGPFEDESHIFSKNLPVKQKDNVDFLILEASKKGHRNAIVASLYKAKTCLCINENPKLMV